MHGESPYSWDPMPPQLDHPTYLNERRFALEAERDQSKLIDQAVLSLSGGALGVSLTFLREFAPHPAPSTQWLLMLGWAALIVSMLLVLVSMHCSQSALRHHVDSLDRDQRGELARSQSRSERSSYQPLGRSNFRGQPRCNRIADYWRNHADGLQFTPISSTRTKGMNFPCLQRR